MTPEALTYLREHIAQWRAIVDGTAADTQNAPLCALFYGTVDAAGQGCTGCPVRESSGKPYCAGSPYVVWNNLLGQHLSDDTPATLSNFPLDVVDEARDAAREELDFLRSLLPKDDPDHPDNAHD